MTLGRSGPSFSLRRDLKHSPAVALACAPAPARLRCAINVTWLVNGQGSIRKYAVGASDEPIELTESPRLALTFRRLHAEDAAGQGAGADIRYAIKIATRVELRYCRATAITVV
jgi:hypothetical protein